MEFTKRAVIGGIGALGAGCLIGRSAVSAALPATTIYAAGNPLFPGLGVADPQIRIYDDEAFLYSTHDLAGNLKDFTMKDWRVLRSRDLVNWSLASILHPEETYFKKPSSDCWATDAAHRDGKYYLYFSMGPKNIGVVVSNSPVGPWIDPLEKPLIADGLVPVQARDPGILQDSDGNNYIVFGTWDYYIARLGDDMVSLAEHPRLINITDRAGPYGVGRTDDKPFLHRRGKYYYLSWGAYYAVGTSPYGPFGFRETLLKPVLGDETFREPKKVSGAAGPELAHFKNWYNLDRHGSFFQLHGQWYFACNDQSGLGAGPYFRDIVISRVYYRDNGDIAPIRLKTTGVGQYSALEAIDMSSFFQADGVRVRDRGDDVFDVELTEDRACLIFPNIRNIPPSAAIDLDAAGITRDGVVLEVRQNTPKGKKLGSLDLFTGHRIPLKGHGSTETLCLIITLRRPARAPIYLKTFRINGA